MLDYSIEIKDDIVITIKKPVAPQEQLEQLEIMKDMLLLHEFIHWISFLPIDPTKEEWGYWEAKARFVDPVLGQQGYIRKQGRKIAEMEKELEELEKENSNMNREVEEARKIIKNKAWTNKSLVITLETENEKLKNKLDAYEHHKKK